jgi:hypothetical protein
LKENSTWYQRKVSLGGNQVHMVSTDLGDMSDQGREQVHIYGYTSISMTSGVTRWVLEGLRIDPLSFVAYQLYLQEILADL